MADISGIGAFQAQTTRSTFDPEEAAQRRAEERARQEETQEARRTEAAQEEVRRAEETENTGTPAGQDQPEEDQVAISARAQEFIIAEREASEATNDNAIEQTDEIAAVQQLTQVGGVNGTNQQTADEDNNAVVNGNQDNQSEQTRALGQIVDQFA